MPTIKQLSRIISTDASLNRLQDQLASALNPILREVKGDLTGPLESPIVTGLQGISVSTAVPTTGQALVYDGTQWAPGSGGGGGGVTAVTASSPLASSGGTTPNISLTGVVGAANGGTGLSTSGTAGWVLTADGLGGWTSGPAPGGAPTGPAGGVLGFPGSTYPNPNGLAWTTYAPLVGKNFIDIAAPYNLLPITFKPQDGYPAGFNYKEGQSLEVQGSDAAYYNGVGGAARLLGGNGGGGDSASYGGGGGAVEMIGGMGNYGGLGPNIGGNALVSGGPGTNAYNGSGGGSATMRGGTGLNGPGGHAYVRGGYGGFTGTNGKAYIGDIETAEVRLAATSILTTINGPTKLTPAGTATITAATYQFSPTTTLLPFTSSGNHTLTSTPTIVTAGVPFGQLVLLYNAGAPGTGHIQLNRGAAEALSLSNANPRIDEGGSMLLMFDGTYWIEIMHTQATNV